MKSSWKHALRLHRYGAHAAYRAAISPRSRPTGIAACAPYGIPPTALGTPDATPRQANYANEIYDPSHARRRLATGQGYATPFPNNIIPANRFDPTSLKILALVSPPQNSNLTGNYAGTSSGTLLGYSFVQDRSQYRRQGQSYPSTIPRTPPKARSPPLGNADGLPNEIGGYRGTFIPTYRNG